MTHVVHVRAPCRLHFGMFSFGHAEGPQFGGVGVMIDPPAVEVRIGQANRFTVAGSHSERAARFVEIATASWELPELPACEIQVQAPRDHIGLGVGTQLGLSVAAGLRHFLQLPELTAEELATNLGRGARSAVGTHGFQRGGLIVDRGHIVGQPVGTLAHRAAVPAAWRFVLVTPTNQRGLAGSSEVEAFSRLPPVPAVVTRRLWRLVEQEMLPALERSDSAAFGDAVYRFGRLAGECFAEVQGGPFANPEIARLIDWFRSHEIAGTGQSSWGPTVFAICDSVGEAERLCDRLRGSFPAGECEVTIAAPNNVGARIEAQAVPVPRV